MEGLDTVAFMCNQRYISIEIWVDVYYFLTHLGPTEGYLSTDQFLVYGTSYDILTIITQVMYEVSNDWQPIQSIYRIIRLSLWEPLLFQTSVKTLVSLI